MSAPPPTERSPVALFEDVEALERLWAPPADPREEPAVMFPLPWYRAFLEEVRHREIEVVTYQDLFAESDDWEYTSYYEREFKQWHGRRRDRRKTYLLIQHDVDNLPFFTERMVAMEAACGIRSNIFIFRERAGDGAGRPGYRINHPFYQEAERRGFVIGYHQNALQRAGFDLERAVETYRDDLEFLRGLYDIRFVVPHGGRGAEIDGRIHHNHDVPMPPEWEGRLRWVFNRYGATFSTRWSDGGLRKSRDPDRIARSDIITSFLGSLKRGTRNFCLVHPQRWGYHVQIDQNPMLAEQPWYQEVCRRYGSQVVTRSAS